MQTMSSGACRRSSSFAFNSGLTAAQSAARETQPAGNTSSAEYIASEIKHHKRGFAVAALLLGAITVVVAAVLFFNPGGNKIDSLAVLPFLNAGNDQGADYLSDGISESIIYDLSRLSALKVIPRSSVFRYKGQQTDPQTVARELGVRAVFTGTIRVQGDSIVVSAELIDAKENRLLWGQQYNHKISDTLSVQHEISRNISEKLRLNLSGAEESLLARRQTESGEAYQEYLKGQFWLNKRNEEGFRRAIGFFNHAVENDPSYALAYAGLADCYALLGTYALLEPKEGFPKAKAAAMKALSLDQQLAEAHTSLANILTSYDWDFANAEIEFKKAIALNPNYATAHQWYAEHLQVIGRSDEAMAEIKRAQELDPLSLIISAVAGRIYYCDRKYDQAIDQLNKTLQIDRQFGPASAFLSQAYLKKGLNEQAILTAEELVRSAPGVSVYLTMLGNAYAISGKKKEAQNMLSRLKELSSGHYVQPSYIAMLYAGLGDRDQAFEWLEKAFSIRDDRLVFVMTDPLMDSISGDSRFQDLARRIGLPEHR